MGLFSIFKTTEKDAFPWIKLTDSEQLMNAIEHSTIKPIVLFKHSINCSISDMVITRFENKWNLENTSCDLYYLDLINYRSISNEIASVTGIEHQSPQVIVLKNKQVIYTATHSNIVASEIEKVLAE